MTILQRCDHYMDEPERHDLKSRFLLFILLFFVPIFVGGKRKGGKNNQSRDFKSSLLVHHYMTILLVAMLTGFNKCKKYLYKIKHFHYLKQNLMGFSANTLLYYFVFEALSNSKKVDLILSKIILILISVSL